MASPLETIVARLPGDTGAGTWNGIPLACHNATCIWLHHAEFGRLPGGVNDMPAIFRAQAIVNEIVTYGKALTASWGQVVELPAGSVLLFHDDNGHAAHSCVMYAATHIVGYNQTNWFTSDGVMNGFSVHQTSDINWAGLPPHGKAARTGPNLSQHVYRLTATPGNIACAIYRSRA